MQHPLVVEPLAVTAGEPAGIGPDLVVRLAQEPLADGIVGDIEHDAGEQDEAAICCRGFSRRFPL
jgi:hypothetical protein